MPEVPPITTTLEDISPSLFHWIAGPTRSFDATLQAAPSRLERCRSVRFMARTMRGEPGRGRRGAASDAEADALHLGVVQQRLGRSRPDDGAVAQEIAALRDRERAHHVLLDEQDR